MRYLFVLLLAAFSLSACKRNAGEAVNSTPTKEVIGDVPLIDYDSPQEKFSCRAPGKWGIHEDSVAGTDSITFAGDTMPASIHILQYPSQMDSRTDPDKYAESFWEIDPNNKQPALEKKKIGGNTVILFHQERPFYKLHSHKVDHIERHDYALIPVKGGFFELWHSAPVDSYQKTLPIFEAVVRSFKPKI